MPKTFLGAKKERAKYAEQLAEQLGSVSLEETRRSSTFLHPVAKNTEEDHFENIHRVRRQRPNAEERLEYLEPGRSLVRPESSVRTRIPSETTATSTPATQTEDAKVSGRDGSKIRGWMNKLRRKRSRVGTPPPPRPSQYIPHPDDQFQEVHPLRWDAPAEIIGVGPAPSDLDTAHASVNAIISPFSPELEVTWPKDHGEWERRAVFVCLSQAKALRQIRNSEKYDWSLVIADLKRRHQGAFQYKIEQTSLTDPETQLRTLGPPRWIVTMEWLNEGYSVDQLGLLSLEKVYKLISEAVLDKILRGISADLGGEGDYNRSEHWVHFALDKLTLERAIERQEPQKDLPATWQEIRDISIKFINMVKEDNRKLYGSSLAAIGGQTRRQGIPAWRVRVGWMNPRPPLREDSNGEFLRLNEQRSFRQDCCTYSKRWLQYEKGCLPKKDGDLEDPYPEE
ncbi:hypothetical protein BDZ45DRAFT_747921 [Acephala macrosclerotiorum]|nr:hypothetical protein BDZ45DRAFT_747921 [Acephala macrosclerotiorum]